MMQDGLHIGLAAWINQLRNTGSFAAYPALPIETALVDLATIQSVQDLARAAEFARLVNFVPRQGQVAAPFGDAGLLWRVHRDLLGQMDFATAPWTATELAEYRAARDILYTTDAAGLPGPSPRHLLYVELRNAYQDLVNSGGQPEEIAQALADWLVLGHKQAIEDAFEVIARLSRRSSRTRAQAEHLALNEDPPGVGLRQHDDLPFAPTYFAPLSAIARHTWMEARVSFADLEQAVGTTAPESGWWRAFRANRAGEVHFDYAALTCIRPWFSPALYGADDWKFANGAAASAGNGTDGPLPAYVDTVYLASVRNVTIAPKPSRPQIDPHVLPRAVILDPHPAVLAKLPRPTKAIVSPALQTATLPAPRLLATAVVPAHFTASRLGNLERVSKFKRDQRLLVAQASLNQIAWIPPDTPATPPPTATYVVGFGCEKLPFAPNPNPHYQW